MKALDAIAASSGLPTAQRDPDAIVPAATAIVDGHKRVASETVRKLTRVELLVRSGVIEPHEAAACEWFAGIATLAWDTTGCTANYEGGRSGGGSAHAPDNLMARYEHIADARADYRDAAKLLGPMLAPFEAVVCRNEAFGPAAATAFPALKRSQASHRLQVMLRFCANVLHQRYAGLMGWPAAPAAQPSTAKAKSPEPSPIAAPVSIAAEIDIACMRSMLRHEGADLLWIAPKCHDLLCRELGRIPETYAGLHVVVREGWDWGYVPVASSAIAAAA